MEQAKGYLLSKRPSIAYLMRSESQKTRSRSLNLMERLFETGLIIFIDKDQNRSAFFRRCCNSFHCHLSFCLQQSPHIATYRHSEKKNHDKVYLSTFPYFHPTRAYIEKSHLKTACTLPRQSTNATKTISRRLFRFLFLCPALHQS